MAVSDDLCCVLAKQQKQTWSNNLQFFLALCFEVEGSS